MYTNMEKTQLEISDSEFVKVGGYTHRPSLHKYATG